MFYGAKENGTDENEQNDEGLHIRQNERVPMGQHNQHVPSAYLSGDMYKKKREFRMKVIEQQEREQRKFHAKPAPNFTVIHAVQAQKRTQEEPKITVPVTPRVVHSHRRYNVLAKAKVSIPFLYTYR